MAAPLNNMARISLRRLFPLCNVQGPAIIEHRCASTTETNEASTTKQKISKAMKAYLERARAHDAFLKQQQHEFSVGKRHLANMMGTDPEMFEQEDIDKSIQYLFPSGLFEPKARPIMKPPEQVLAGTKAAEFDESGRPHHYLFYTTRPNFSSLLHSCSDKLDELDAFEDKMIREQRKPDPEQKLNLLGSVWIGKESLEKKLLEKLVDVEFQKFMTAMERIANHPYAYKATEFMDQFRIKLMAEKKQAPPAEPQVAEDGRRFVTFTECKRKNTQGTVTVTVPGTGKFSINGQGIDYFSKFLSRQQVSYLFHW